MRRRTSLMRQPPKYCHGYIDCRGKPRWYLRRAGHKRVPLPGTALVAGIHGGL
jgi:hypothetical protein